MWYRSATYVDKILKGLMREKVDIIVAAGAPVSAPRRQRHRRFPSS
jgi:hypothetical protein